MTNITESEMNAAWNTFDAMRNAVIEGSKLREDVDKLTAQVQAMQAELSRNTEYAKNLEETIASMRKSRDDALADSSALRSENRNLSVQVANANQQVQSLQAQLTAAQAQVQQLTKERDDALMAAMEHEEKANSFRSVLDTVRAKLAEVGLSFPVQPQEDKVAEPQPSPAESTAAPVAPEVATPEVPTSQSEHGGSTGSDGSGSSGEMDSEGRPIQPRDPVTQQWRSPYNEI